MLACAWVGFVFNVLPSLIENALVWYYMTDGMVDAGFMPETVQYHLR